MSKYALIKSLGLRTSEERMIRAAKGEFEERTFMASVLRIAHSRSALNKAEVEIEAQILGVTEYIWPFDPKKMQTAIEAEARGEPISGLDAEVVADAVDDVGDDDLGFDQIVVGTERFGTFLVAGLAEGG